MVFEYPYCGYSYSKEAGDLVDSLLFEYPYCGYFYIDDWKSLIPD